jgi:hypothetical protein
MFDRTCDDTYTTVRCVSNLEKRMISLGKLDSLSYSYSARDGVFCKYCVWPAMKS